MNFKISGPYFLDPEAMFKILNFIELELHVALVVVCESINVG